MPTPTLVPHAEPPLADWLRDRWQVVRHYRRAAVLFFFGTLALTAVGLLIVPRVYLSQAKLFVRLGRESVTLDPTATTSSTITIADTREAEISSVLEMISSRALLEQVVRTLGPEVVLGDQPLPSESVLESMLRTITAGGDRTEADSTPLSRTEEKAVMKLEKSITADHARKSSVITISSEATSPELAQAILRLFVRAFQVQHIRANRTSGSHQFFAEQTGYLRQELAAARDELRDAKNEVGVLSLEGRRSALEEQMTAVRRELMLTEATFAATEAAVAELQSRVRSVPERLITDEVANHPEDAVGMTRRALYDLQMRERDLLTKYTKYHPLVMATREQIEAARKLLTPAATPEAKPIIQTTSRNPAHEEIASLLVTDEVEVESLRQKTAALRSQHDGLHQELRSLNEQEGRIARLQQYVSVLESNYGEYLDKLEQARIDSALEAEQISNVNLVQPPSYFSRPVSPKKKLIAALAVFVATTGGIGITFLCELLDQLRRPPMISAAQLEAALGTRGPEFQRAHNPEVCPAPGEMEAVT